MNILIRPEAEAEIAEAFDYYEAVSEGLGAAFLLAVEACLDRIQRSPDMYAAIYKDIRRALLRRSPTASSTSSSRKRSSYWHASTRAATRNSGSAADNSIVLPGHHTFPVVPHWSVMLSRSSAPAHS